MKQKTWNPKKYDKNCTLQYNTAMAMLDSLGIKEDEKILDIGCGTGKISYQMANERLSPKGSIFGIDVNELMINYAKSHYRKDNLHFECLDVLNMEYEDYFDRAVSFWTLSWIPLNQQLKAFDKIIHSLHEDGQLFLMYP